jgi:hypothetical protein
MSSRTFLAASVGLLCAGCGTSGLNPLVLQGYELDPSLVTWKLDVPHPHVPRAVLRDNPQVSTDAEFVEAIARAGSQGQVDGQGVRAALHALYLGESDLGFYGLEAASTEDADRLESLLRGIWARNVSLDRARVHRGGKLVVVVWSAGVSRGRDGAPASARNPARPGGHQPTTPDTVAKFDIHRSAQLMGCSRRTLSATLAACAPGAPPAPGTERHDVGRAQGSTGMICR